MQCFFVMLGALLAYRAFVFALMASAPKPVHTSYFLGGLYSGVSAYMFWLVYTL